MRTRRRTFAAPLVITVAAGAGAGGLAACGSKEQIRRNPPPPEREITEWTVYKADGECFAVDALACPVPPDDSNAKFTCTSTSTPYQCPELLSLERPIVVVKVPGAECEMKQEMPDCPVGASCNPPPPMPLACPTN